MNKSQSLSHGFKEWAIAVSTLAAGKTIMLLRKGGIREENRNFQIKYQQAWLYPTYEHQKPDLLKPEYAPQVQTVPSLWHPETVTITSYADITQVISVSSPEIVNAIASYHIWNQTMIEERLKWKPHQPLSILLLRVYNLTQPVTIPFHSNYGGCKSWIELIEPISLSQLKPVLDDNTYQNQVEEILSKIYRYSNY